MSSVLVTGANRGIGLGLTRQLLADSSVATVIATTRNVDSAKDLQALSCPKLHIIQLDVVCEESIANAAKKVSEIVGDNGLDILINNAGIAYIAKLNGEVSKAKVIEQFEVNTIAPLLIANKFYPLLKKAASLKGSAQIANISSRIGSLENATTVRGAMPITVYGISKTALNMLTRRIAVEWKDDNIRATAFCPGWVQTDMGGQTAHLTVDESTIPLTKLILSLTEEHNGYYYTNTGEKIPWEVDSTNELKAINSPKLHFIQLEVTDEDSIEAAAKSVAEIVGSSGLDLLINNAGIGYLDPLNGDVSKAKIIEQFDVNTIAPLLVANKFYPLLKDAATRNGSAQIANISSHFGCLEDSPKVPKELSLSVYCMTKSALNMITRRIAVEWKEDNIRATTFCPGWVKTDMGTEAAELSVDESTIPLSKLILSLTEENNGHYYRYNGEKIPW